MKDIIPNLTDENIEYAEEVAEFIKTKWFDIFYRQILLWLYESYCVDVLADKNQEESRMYMQVIKTMLDIPKKTLDKLKIGNRDNRKYNDYLDIIKEQIKIDINGSTKNAIKQDVEK